MALHDSIAPAVRHTPFIRISDSLLTAAEYMAEYDTSALIVKDGEVMVGVITDMDVMDGIVRNHDFSGVEVGTCMTACQLLGGNNLVKSPCVQLDQAESVENALKAMSAAGIHNLLVACEMGVGTCMVNIRDLLKIAVA